MYAVKEIYFTLQGEGKQSGRAAVFLRFAGCNLWSGREKDREKARCQFCDTDFVGLDGPNGGRYVTAESLALKALSFWPEGERRPFIVCTGGEPLLQLDEALIKALKHQGFEIALETNGSLEVPDGIDWITVSPKQGVSELVQKRGDELKLVYPQQALPPEMFSELDFQIFSLQPLDDENQLENMQKACQYCLKHPRWRLSLQTHKWLGIP